MDHRVDSFQPVTAGRDACQRGDRIAELCLSRSTDLVVVAPGFVIGPGGYFKEALYDHARQNGLRVVGSGDNYWSCIEVTDLASAFVAALEGALPGGEYKRGRRQPDDASSLGRLRYCRSEDETSWQYPTVRDKRDRRQVAGSIHGQLVSRPQSAGAPGAGLGAEISSDPGCSSIGSLPA